MIPNRRTILGLLPPFMGEQKVLVYNQDVDDIINGILKTHTKYKNEYNNIYQYFDGFDLEDTAWKIFSFLKQNVPYSIESEKKQFLKSPASIVSTKGDCKSYALFANGVADAIRRNTGKNFDVIYRFASYDAFDKTPAHVFAIVKDGNNEYWIDPVLDSFNERKQPYYFKDKKIPMALVGLSGVKTESSNTITKQTPILTWGSIHPLLQKNKISGSDSGSIDYGGYDSGGDVYYDPSTDYGNGGGGDYTGYDPSTDYGNGSSDGNFTGNSDAYNSTDTGSTDTSSTDTGSTDTGSTDTSSTDTGSSPSGSGKGGNTNWAQIFKAAFDAVSSLLNGQPDWQKWQQTLSKKSANVRAITYLLYIKTLPPSGSGDTQANRFNQYRELFGRDLSNGSVSKDIADAWNAQWLVMSKTTNPDQNLLNSQFTASSSTNSGFITNGEINKTGVQSAGSTGLILPSVLTQKLNSAPAATSSSLLSTGTGMTAGISTFVILGLIGAAFFMFKKKK